MRRILVVLCVLSLMAGGCGGAKRSKAKDYRFTFVAPPAHLADSVRVEYMRDHYWDKFDFADSLAATKADTTDMLRAFAIYVADYVGPIEQQPIRQLMQRASASKQMFDYFAMLAREVLYDANSPLRSDELYMAVLEAQATSPLYDKYERMVPEYDLRMVSQNRIGHYANDFRYTLASGKSGSFYGIKSDLTILYFANPDCAMCRDITEQLSHSAVILEAEKRGRLKIITVYPDRDLDAWHRHISEYPKSWINSYDADCTIERERLYDLKAIPSLYLVDSRKRVLVKDSTSVGELEYMINLKSEQKR